MLSNQKLIKIYDFHIGKKSQGDRTHFEMISYLLASFAEEASGTLGGWMDWARKCPGGTI